MSSEENEFDLEQLNEFLREELDEKDEETVSDETEDLPDESDSTETNGSQDAIATNPLVSDFLGDYQTEALFDPDEIDLPDKSEIYKGSTDSSKQNDAPISVDDLLNLEDVDALLAAAENVENAGDDSASIPEDDDIKEINDILSKSDSNEVVDDDLLSLLDNIEDGPDNLPSLDEDGADAEPDDKNSKTKKKDKKKDKKSKKGKDNPEDGASDSGEDIPSKSSSKEGKKSFLDKIKDFMFDDDGDEEEEASADKAKPEKKKKDKKGKKGAAAKKQGGDSNADIEKELEEEDIKNSKDSKKKKDSKPKKEKKKKEKKTEEEPKDSKSKSISTKNIILIMLVCFSILGLILAASYFIPEYLSLKAARTAYYMSDYEEAALRFYGHKLNDSDALIYRKASLLYDIQLRIGKHDSLKSVGRNEDALDALLTARKECDEKRIEADSLGITDELNVFVKQIDDLLESEYSLSKEDTADILSMRKLYYTMAVKNIIEGNPYNSFTLDEESETQEETSEEETEEVVLEDMLPEEEGLLPLDPSDLPSGEDDVESEEESSEEESSEEEKVLFEQPVTVSGD